MARTIRYDVLILGAGGGGLRCAAELAQSKAAAKILAVTKVSHPQKSHTATAQGGLATVDPADPVDKPIYHMFDTWKGSDCSADQNVIRRIAEEAWEQIIWLERHGMHFSRDEEGKFSKRTFGGHTVRFGEAPAYRAVFEADRTGKGMMETIWGEALKASVEFMSQCVATELLFHDGRCVGAVLFHLPNGEFIRVLSRATVIATGGCGQVYKITTNCRQNTGDGLAMALKAGIPLMDPEAVQFHPTGIVGPGILASEAMRAEGGILRNKDLEPFMERYAPKMKDLAPRDLVSRAIEQEIAEGRGILNPDHQIGHVWIDLRHLSQYVHDVKLKELTSFFRKFVLVDPKRDLCPVRPSNHYHMGGIPTNEHGEVRGETQEIIPGLYAVGECAAASFHGFNRLGSNSLLELITMGRFVGQRIAEAMKSGQLEEPPEAHPSRTIEEFRGYLEANGRGNILEIRERLRELMSQKVGIFRNEKGLKEAIEELKDLHERARQIPLDLKDLRMNQQLLNRWELDNMLWVSMAIASGALNRRESRGAHFREDYPDRDDAFHHHSIVCMETFGETSIRSRPIDMSIYREGGPAAEKFGILKRTY
jgi:succinate dehydrogenase / fumarate reductase flavoprotein subunit